MAKRRKTGKLAAPAVLYASFEQMACRYRPHTAEHPGEAWCHLDAPTNAWSKFGDSQIFMYGEILPKGEYDRRFGTDLPPLPAEAFR